MGALEDADLARPAALALLAEQLQVHPLGGHAGGADGHELALGPRAGGVDQARDGLLARAGRAGDQHPAVGRGQLGDHLAQLLGGHGLADQAVGRDRLGAQPAVLALQVGRLQRALDHQQQPVGLERLLQEVVGAALDGADRRLDVAVAGDHDHRQVGVQLLDQVEQLQPVHAAALHPDVEHQQRRACAPGWRPGPTPSHWPCARHSLRRRGCPRPARGCRPRRRPPECPIEDSEHNRRFLTVIRKNAERMHNLIDDILELSSIEAGIVTVEPRPVRLSAVIEDITTALAARAETRGVTLRNEIAQDVHVYADARRLEQMLTNLIDNAVKFNREGGEVTVRYKTTETRDCISVTDTGDGVSGEHIERIFERFYRIDRARSRDMGGTGLGLAIVKHLARAHGGEATVQSTPGEGSTFTIELPKQVISDE